ncbi:MAG: uroporphyrinogen decarboxylase family protein [Bacillota bacterium]|jgi:uroporphyrinogen decarboxylase
MSKKDRLKSVLAGRKADRIPYSVWFHSTLIDFDPKKLAEIQYSLYKEMDFDFVKLMPNGLYSTIDWGNKIKMFDDGVRIAEVETFAVQSPSDWAELGHIDPGKGAFGQANEALRIIKDMADGEIVVLQTVFSPLTTAIKMARPVLKEHMRTNADKVHQGLGVIADVTAEFVRQAIDAGADGLFFATQLATTEMTTTTEYEEFGVPYDQKVLAAAQDAWFNILHLHGNNPMVELGEKYDVHVLNWHDKRVGPSLAEYRGSTKRCLMGGLNEEGPLYRGPDSAIRDEVFKAVKDAGECPLILTPGCVTPPDIPLENIHAVRKALEEACGTGK